jgi:glycine/D-amino acid oxidase-like deaminating enzyme
MNVIVVGNGAIALMTARELLVSQSVSRVTLIGPASRPGCASLAAAAMFNSFAEVDAGTLKNRFEAHKWSYNRAATPLWPDLLAAVEAESGKRVRAGFGTYVINNQASDQLEDDNFDAIVDALTHCAEPHHLLAPRDIPSYNPSSPHRAGRAVFIPREGWVNPVDLMSALDALLAAEPRFCRADGVCGMVRVGANGRLESAVTVDGAVFGGDVFVLAPGASFSTIVRASDLPITFPRVFYGVGCTTLLRTKEETLSHCIRTPNRGLACGVYAAPRDDEHTVVGASNLISPEPIDHGRVSSIYTLLKAAMEQINARFYRSELVSVNVGWRPTSEDTLPMIGRTRIDNLLVATGTKRDGLHCSPLTARCLTSLALGREPEFDLAMFKPDREPIRIYSRSEAISLAWHQIRNAAFQHDFVPAKNRMLEEMKAYHVGELEKLHDKVGAHEWGIPPEMLDMYRYGHAN